MADAALASVPTSTCHPSIRKHARDGWHNHAHTRNSKHSTTKWNSEEKHETHPDCNYSSVRGKFRPCRRKTLLRHIELAARKRHGGEKATGENRFSMFPSSFETTAQKATIIGTPATQRSVCLKSLSLTGDANVGQDQISSSAQSLHRELRVKPYREVYTSYYSRSIVKESETGRK